jgi:exosortase/archaeosortase family protein
MSVRVISGAAIRVQKGQARERTARVRIALLVCSEWVAIMGTPARENSFVDNQRARADFARRFAISALLLFAAYLYPYPGTLRSLFALYLAVYAHLAGGLLHAFDARVRVVGATIFGRTNLSIVRGCDAAEILILYTSAVLATRRAPGRHRGVGLALGVAAITALNFARIVSIYYAGIIVPNWTETLHFEVWPCLLTTVAVGLYVVWRRRFERKNVR